MKILMVSSFLPYPLYSGGHIRLYNLLKNLPKEIEVTLICEKRKTQTEKDVKEVEKICKKVITVERKFQWAYSNILKTGFSKNCFLITGHTLPEMKSKIKYELENIKYDLIHVETFYVMQNLPKTSIPIVLAEHNVEYLVYKRYMDKAPFLIKPLLLIDILKLKKQEIDSWRRATKLVAVSKEDRDKMGREDTELVANGVDINKYKMEDVRYQKKKEKTLLFIGDFNWIQNVNAAESILKEIWPKIIERNNDLKLWIVGRMIPKRVKSIGGVNVVFDENAPSKTEEIYKRADILLAPIYIGGGTSYKILEAMASGVSVVTTSLGAEGIIEFGSNEVSIANTSDDLANLVIRLINDNEYRVEQIKNARKLIEENFDWKKIAQKLDNIYESVVKT